MIKQTPEHGEILDEFDGEGYLRRRKRVIEEGLRGVADPPEVDASVEALNIPVQDSSVPTEIPVRQE